MKHNVVESGYIEKIFRDPTLKTKSVFYDYSLINSNNE